MQEVEMPMPLNCSVRIDLLLAAVPVPVLDPASPDAASISHLFFVVLLICTVILLVVVGLIATSVVRFRSAGPDLPKQDFGSRRSEVIWAMLPVLIVLAFGAISVRLILSIITVPTARAAEAGDADLVVVGHQWWWEVRYPVSGAVTANEIHIPVGRKLLVRVDSADVIHSFWVPQLGPKMDMVPGHPNFVWLQADRAGEYEGACSEFCGDQHAWMRFIVVAESAPQYDAWLARQAHPAIAPSGAAAQAGERFFFKQTCANCHAIGGTGAVANAAPDLTHVATRRQLAAGIIPNTRQDLARWLRNPQQIKPGCLMPNFSLDDEQVTQLVAYLEGLR
jgi:cytochrome c oxidase subunit 2